MSVRFFETTMPISHVNGKMSRVAQKVKNAHNSNPSASAFYYGYRKDGTEISRYGLREIPRNLTANPYTTAEQGNKEYFAQSVANAKLILTTPTMRAKALHLFEKSKYKRLYNYCLARCRANGGEIPLEIL